MMKAKKDKQRLPDWAKNPEKYQYEEARVSTVSHKPKVIHQEGVKRPQVWTPKDVLKNYGK